MSDRPPADGGTELVKALGDADPSVRKAAAFALSSCLTERNRPALIQATRDSHHDVRAGAVVTLSLYKDKPAAERLGEVLAGDANESIQTIAASGLGMNPSPAAIVALLENAEKHRSVAVRRQAMKHLIAKVGLRLWRDVDPLGRDWPGLLELMKDHKKIQDAYAACNATLHRRSEDKIPDEPGHGADK